MFTNRLVQLFSVLVSAFIFISAASAHEFKSGAIQIDHPFARPTVAQQTSSAAYFGLENKGSTTDKLLKVESSIAQSTEIHNMEMVGDIMKMREVSQIELKAGSKIMMKPGSGYHVMLMGLNQQLKAGEHFPLTLYFEKAGKIVITMTVEE